MRFGHVQAVVRNRPPLRMPRVRSKQPEEVHSKTEEEDDRAGGSHCRRILLSRFRPNDSPP
jgi:hypothetical protein